MNNKKFLSLVLSLVMVLGTFTSVFAASTTDKKDEKTTETKVEKVEKIVGKDNKIQYIIDKKFVEGYEDGDYGYDKNIKRSEITKLLVFANGHKELSEKLQGSMKVYSDVDTAFWANGVITVGTTVPSSSNNQAMLNGYPTGKFLPERNVTYAELAKMLVVLAKEDLTADMVKTANKNWASQWMTWAAELGILDDVTVANSDAFATRADAFTMLYNALYKMQNFKREPANDKLGILSDLTNKKLTLNQDSEEEYTITDDTVFVKQNSDRETGDNDNVVKVSSIRDPKYYLGSLVRIMYNDKKEVTHILELGNPKDGALANRNVKAEKGFGDLTVYKDNKRWNDVADHTISTEMVDKASLKDLEKEDFGGKNKINTWAEIGFKNKTDVDEITFKSFDKDLDKVTKTVTIDVDDDDVKVFVANPANKRMKEVKDIYEALRLIGYNTDLKQIPNVYVGYDNDSKDTAYGEIGKNSEAKVIVFNVVSKDDDMSQLYRVLDTTSSKGKSVLEDVDGKKFERNDFEYSNNYPFDEDLGKVGDIIEVDYDYVGRTYEVTRTVIEAKETDDYPIVKVTDVDGNFITVEDEEGNTALINIKDADIFTKEVKEGDHIQFALDNKNEKTLENNAEAISIVDKSLDGDMADKDVLNDWLTENQEIAKLTSVQDEEGKTPSIKVEVYKNPFENTKVRNDEYFVENVEDAKALKGYVGEKIKYTTKVKDDKDYAHTFYVLENNAWVKLNTTEVEEVTLAEFLEAYNKLELNQDKLTLKDEAKYEKVKAMYNNLSDSDKTAVAIEIEKVNSALAENAIFDQLEDAKTNVKNEISKAEKKLIELKKEPETNASAIKKLELGLKVAKDANLDASTKSELETIKTDLETAQV